MSVPRSNAKLYRDFITDMRVYYESNEYDLGFEEGGVGHRLVKFTITDPGALSSLPLVPLSAGLEAASVKSIFLRSSVYFGEKAIATPY